MRGRTGTDPVVVDRLDRLGGLRRGLLALVALGLALGSCAKPNTVLLVTVEDDSQRLTTITQLKVLVTVGDARSEFNAPETGRLPIKFPTTLTVEMDRSLSGGVNVRVDAINASIQTLASASATLPALNVGHTNRIAVHLGPTTPDGGTDAGIDARDASSEVGPVDARADLPDEVGPGPDGPGNDTPGTGGLSGTGGTSGAGGTTGAGGTGTGGTGMGGTGVGGTGAGGMGVGGDLGVGGDTGGGGDVDAGDDADPDVPVD